MKKKQKWKGGRKRFSSKEGYDIYAPYYEKDHPFLDTFDRALLFGMIGDVSGKRVLDVGAGSGRIMDLLCQKGSEVVAVDLSEEMLKNLKKRHPEVEIVVGDAEELAFADSSFDMVVATFLIVHLKDLKWFFEEVYRILKDGGVFVLSNVNQRKPPRLGIDEGEMVIDSFYHMPQKVVEALEEAWFKVEKEEFVNEEGVWVNQILKVRK